MTIEALPLTRALATATPRAASAPLSARTLLAAGPTPSRSLVPRVPISAPSAPSAPSPSFAPRPKRAAVAAASPALALASELAASTSTASSGGGVSFDLAPPSSPSSPAARASDGGEGSSVGVSVEAPDLLWYALGAALLAWGAWEVYRRRR